MIIRGEQMTKLEQIIKTCKRLIDLPYNKFNLDNYFPFLYKTFKDLGFKNTDLNLPIRLMSGNHNNSGIVTYNQLVAPYRKRNIYIVGKGILFDSGGMDLKLRGMDDMTGDKAGMIIALSVANYLKDNVIAYCPVTTNFIHTSKIIPGDEIKIGNKIVKVNNTDAEGRLILAEALSTLRPNKNDIIITIATLTGACEYAIGEEATGVFGVNNELLKKYAEASFEAKEYAWGLPIWEFYQKKYYNTKLIKNSIKEIKAGATEGAMFIKQFVPNVNNWIHLDIAGSAFNKGKATGIPIKSLINFIKKIK
jgi:leucyl aminopeptidase